MVLDCSKFNIDDALKIINAGATTTRIGKASYIHAINTDVSSFEQKLEMASAGCKIAVSAAQLSHNQLIQIVSVATASTRAGRSSLVEATNLTNKSIDQLIQIGAAGAGSVALGMVF